MTMLSNRGVVVGVLALGIVVGAVVLLFNCGGSHVPVPTTPPATPSTDAAGTIPRVSSGRSENRASCGGHPLRVHFYDVAQALAALVDLPDGRHILVDTADKANRAGCGKPCSDAHEHLMGKLEADLHGAPIDLLWITHQHSDHIGGAIDVMERFAVKHYVDNGRDLTVKEIKDTRAEAGAKAVPITVDAPNDAEVPISSTDDVHLAAIVPSSWLPKCKTDRNDCSILLRIDYCASSILFTGDAETEEEALIDPHGPATLLQVGHHGSDTSTSAPFLAKVQPKYAVISAGKPGEGMNKTYCHPRETTVEALTAELGGAGSQTIRAFDAKTSCKGSTTSDWVDVPASDRLWATERDGDVVLVTTGSGAFSRE